MTRDAWTGKEIGISKESVPVYLKERCSHSGVPAPGSIENGELTRPNDRPASIRCPGCSHSVEVRRDGRIFKHNNPGPTDPQDVIVLQTTSRCRIEISGNELPQFIEQLIETLNRKEQK